MPEAPRSASTPDWAALAETLRVKRAALEKARRNSERALHTRAALAGLTGFLKVFGLYGRGVRNANRPVLTEHDVFLPALPPALDGYRILHVSDFHFDSRPDFTEAVCDLLDPVEAGLCLMTGDYRYGRSGPIEEVLDPMARVAQCIHARDGIAASLGNHDTLDLVPPLEALGIRMLVNQSEGLTLEGSDIWILGVDDSHYYQTHSIPLAHAEVPERAFKILLAHTPELYRESQAHGVDLYLCGHTHSGQIRLPLLGPVHANTRSPKRYREGLWNYKTLRGHTSAGLGTTDVPVRYLCPPEATVLTLRAER